MKQWIYMDKPQLNAMKHVISKHGSSDTAVKSAAKANTYLYSVLLYCTVMYLQMRWPLSGPIVHIQSSTK